MTPLRLIINGAQGRMGQALISNAAKDPALEVVGELDVGDDLELALPGAEAVIDFTHAEPPATTRRQDR